MKGDFTRSTFRPEKHYSRVLQQQGRVQLDADWNEALDILAYRDRTARIDIIGHCCAPQSNAGFEIAASGGGLTIGAGRYYAAGMLVENETALPFTAQIDLPDAELPEAAGRYLFYLDVWERHITALEDPDIREVALGGPDTATRAQIVSQVKWQAVPNSSNCGDIEEGWQPAGAASGGALAARAQLADDEEDPCIVPPTAGYRRLENQLYRVEIHEAGPRGSATFKWSRENGSVVAEWVGQDGNTLTVAAEGRDDNLSFHPTDWVELTDDNRELHGNRGILVQLASVEGRDLVIDATTIDDPDNPAATAVDFTQFGPTPKIRRWESNGAEAVQLGPPANDGFLRLESGVEIRFSAGDYQTGDYWLIPARTNIGDVLWPRDTATNQPIPESRHGIDHHYCPLALATFGPNSGWTDITDCRCTFPPLSELPFDSGADCCTVTVGDGSLSEGEFSSIQEAIDSLDGFGKVCILPGTYRLSEPIRVDERAIEICGCGRQTHIIGPQGEPALVARSSQIRIDALTITASSTNGAVVYSAVDLSAITNCLIRNILGEGPVDLTRGVRRPANLRGLRAPDSAARLLNQNLGPAVVVLGDSDEVTIADNYLMGRQAVVLQGDKSAIENNRIFGGGVWLWDGSNQVAITGNLIAFGVDAGVILGGVSERANLRQTEAGVEAVEVRHNHIHTMAHSGVTTATKSDRGIGLGDVTDVTLAHNRIEGCAQEPLRDSIYDGQAHGGVALHNTAWLRIHDNTIVNNGRESVAACGVYLELVEGAELTNNHIAENGTSQFAGERCVDFRQLERGEDEGPLERDNFVFHTLDENGAEVWQIGDDPFPDAGNKLSLKANSIIEFKEPADVATMLVFGDALEIIANNADGSTVAAKTKTSFEEPQQVTLNGASITHIETRRVESEAGAYLLEICAQGRSSGVQAGIMAIYAIGGELTLPQEDTPFGFRSGRPALMAHDNVVIAPAGPALVALAVGPVSIADNTLVSLGNYEQPRTDNENALTTLLRTGVGAAVVNLGMAAELAATLSNMSGGKVSVVGTDAARSVPSLPHGYTSFIGNQVTCEYSAPGRVIPKTAVTLVALDDVALHDNQMLVKLDRAIQLSNALLFGATVKANGNRFSERFNTVLASCLSIGILNNTSSNIATHCIFAGGSDVVQRDNQIVNTARCPDRRAGLAGAAGLANFNHVTDLG